MFERFSDDARRVIVMAQEEARVLHHHYIGTEHLLLGLSRGHDSVACKTLESLGVTLEAVHQRVADTIAPEPSEPSGHVPFTAHAKRVLEGALAESARLGHNYIGPEHILLALAQEQEGAGARLLEAESVDLDRLPAAVLATLTGEPIPADTSSTSRLLSAECLHPSQDLRWEPAEIDGPTGPVTCRIVRCGLCDTALGVIES